MHSKFPILRAEAADLPALMAFAELTFRAAYQAQNDPEAFRQYSEKAFTLERFQAEWQNPDSTFWYMENGGQMAAYLKLNARQPQAELGSQRTMQIERIYVAPGLQGQGIGSELLLFSEKWAETANADWIWLSVWHNNPAAVRFYERHGYVIFGSEMFPLGSDPQLDWLMCKRVG
jgi:hypothetical protein